MRVMMSMPSLCHPLLISHVPLSFLSGSPHHISAASLFQVTNVPMLPAYGSSSPVMLNHWQSCSQWISSLCDGPLTCLIFLCFLQIFKSVVKTYIHIYNVKEVSVTFVTGNFIEQWLSLFFTNPLKYNL